MKPLYRLLIAVVVLAVVLGVLYWPKKATPPVAAAPPLVSINVADVQTVTVTQAAQPPTELVRSGSDWKMQQPYNAPGDDAAVVGMLGSLGNITGAQDVGPTANPSAFGFDQPGDVTLGLSNGQKLDFQFGSDTPTGGNAYLRLGANGPIKIVPNYVKENALKTAFMLQDKKILHITPDQLTALEVTYQGKKLSLPRTNGQWPKDKQDTAQPLVDAVNDGQMTAMADASGKDAAKDGLSHPTAELKFTTATGSATLTIGDKKGAAEYYARNSESPAIFTLSDYIVTDIATVVNPAKSPTPTPAPGSIPH